MLVQFVVQCCPWWPQAKAFVVPLALEMVLSPSRLQFVADEELDGRCHRGGEHHVLPFLQDAAIRRQVPDWNRGLIGASRRVPGVVKSC